MPDVPLSLFSPHDVHDAERPLGMDWDDYPVRFLAQGDSWFSIGALPPWATSNVLQQLRLGYSASAINCAYPRRELAHMEELLHDAGFAGLLTGPFACSWSGILLSGGGNDLIAAAGVMPLHADGTPIPPDRRLFLEAGEWSVVEATPARYLSAEGWKRFCRYIDSQFREVIALRDSGINRDVPLFCHGYDYPMPRNAPASRLFGVGPWLSPSLRAYVIPEADGLAVASELIDRLDTLLLGIIDDLSVSGVKNIHFVDSRGSLEPASAGSTGVSHDWENEIHPTPKGYAKLAACWRSVIDGVIHSP